MIDLKPYETTMEPENLLDYNWDDFEWAAVTGEETLELTKLEKIL